MNHDHYKKTTLDNGLRVITEHIPTVRSVSVGIWVLTGSRHETPEENGISHFVEHMVFKGTRQRSYYDIALSLEQVGGALNAFTSKELTCYYARLLDEHLPLAMDVLSDILLNSVFDPAELEKEKKVVIEEINNMEDTPDDLIHEMFSAILFGKHPLGWSILGSRDVIGGLDRQQIVDYLERQYDSRQIIVAAAGNVDHDRLVDMVSDKCAFGTAAYRAPVPCSPAPDRKRITAVKKDILQSHICLGAEGLPYDHPDRFNLLLANTVMGSGMSSRLFQNIREKAGMAYSVYSYLDFYSDAGVVGTYAATEPDKTKDALTLLLAELNRLRSEDIPSGELEKCKSQLKGSLLLGLESTSNRMTHLARTEIFLQRFVGLDEIIRNIDSVEAPAVRRTAAACLAPEHLVASCLSPLPEDTLKGEDLTYE